MTLAELIHMKLGQLIVDDSPDRLGYTKSGVLAEAILSWFKEEVLPKERKPMIQDFSFYENGYNCCLKDILTNMETSK